MPRSHQDDRRGTRLVSPHSNTGGNSGYGQVGTVSASLFHVATDYLRLTCDDSGSAESLALECVAIAREFRDRGDRPKPWRYIGGYEDGWSCGPIAYAEGHESVIVQASSVASDPLFLACKGKGLIVKPTRIDPQVTVDLGHDDPEFGRRMAEVADRYRFSGAREGRPFKVHYRDGYGDGGTLELGARGSEVYLRLYDKHRESFKKPHRKTIQAGQFPAGTWRFEGELKDAAASELFHRLSVAPSVSEGVLREVRGLFSDRGIDLPIGEGAAPPIREIKHRPDLQRKLEWLLAAVRPSVEELITEGYEGEMLAALGLADRRCVDLSVLLLSRPSEKRT